MRRVTFTIPGDPQGKGRSRSTKSGRHYTPEKTVAYEGLIAHAAHIAMAGQGLLDGPLSLTLEAVFSVPASASKKRQAAMLAGEIAPTKKPDLSNILKAVEDGCNGVVFRDDSAITKHINEKRYGPVPSVVVTIEGE